VSAARGPTHGRALERPRTEGGDERPRPRRVLVTGLGTFWGGHMAQALEADPNVEVIVGLDPTEPTVELERTEYVRVDAN
jgi:UDP-glucose 4-epimerase